MDNYRVKKERKELSTHQKDTVRLYYTSPIPLQVVKRYAFLSLLHCLKMKCPPNSAICRTTPSEMKDLVSVFMGKALTERQMIDAFKNLITSGDIEKLAKGVYWINFTVPESCEEACPNFKTPSWALDKTIPVTAKEIAKKKAEKFKKPEPKQDKLPKTETNTSEYMYDPVLDFEDIFNPDQNYIPDTEDEEPVLEEF